MRDLYVICNVISYGASSFAVKKSSVLLNHN